MIPRSIEALRRYTLYTLAADLIAGLTVGLVALPLAMAFAISSGVPPQAGLYCAVVAGFLISALGGSMTAIGGPTGAFVAVSGIIAKHGVDGLFMCTMMAVLILVALGVTGMGTAVKFIPRPIVVGFTNGIVPSEFLARAEAIALHVHTFSPAAAILGCASLGIIVVCRACCTRSHCSPCSCSPHHSRSLSLFPCCPRFFS
ncbi:MAG: hypothetical protein EXQ52_04590 [Bryobacterales bacterium]|nr:hypothetical protein [Bryobacterales bacterium]